MVSVKLPAARFGEDAPIAVLENDYRTLNQTFGAWVAFLIEQEAMLERLCHDSLHSRVCGRVNLNVPRELFTSSRRPSFVRRPRRLRILKLALTHEEFLNSRHYWRKEVLVLSGEGGAANYRRDLFVLADPPVFVGHLHERPAIRIVDVTNGGKVEADEWSQVRQIGSVKINAIETNPYTCGRYERCTKEKPGGWPPPAQCGIAATADSVSRDRLSALPACG